MGRKKKNLSWSGEKKTYPHIEEGSLCHRPSNCNSLIELVWALQEFSARNCELVSPLRGISCTSSRSIFLAPPAHVFGVNCLESSLWQRLWRRGKKYTWDLSYSEGRGKATFKRRAFWSVTIWHSHPKCSLQVDALNFKHCMEHVESLYLNHQNLRIY